MKLDELQREAAELAPEEQRQLAVYLTTLRMKQNGEWQAAEAAGGAAENWVALDEARRRLLEPR